MYRITLLAVLMVLTGCETLTGIPSTWPSTWPKIIENPKDQCPNIAGTYYDVGQSVSPNHQALLSRLLNISVPNSSNYDWQKITTKLTLQHNETLHVEIRFENSAILDTVLYRRKGDFACDENGLTPKAASGFSAKEGGAGYQKHEITLKAAEGGVIAGEMRNSAAGVAFIFPIVGTQTMWYRWNATP